MNETNLGDKRDEVAKEDFIARLDKFATLATRLDFLGVTTNSLECHPCHVCHIIKQEESTSSSEKQRSIGKEICLQWLQIGIDEGHLEPSQPWVGKMVGWPKRKIPIVSLWVEFCCWTRKEQVGAEEMPEEHFFYGLLNHLFIRHDDMYEFPALEKCREDFALLRLQYECD